jgi:hypothetical protein
MKTSSKFLVGFCIANVVALIAAAIAISPAI